MTRPTFFTDLQVGDIFYFVYESEGNDVFKFTPLLEKTSEEGDYVCRGEYINDTRSKHRVGGGIPKIKGKAYGNATVIKLSGNN